MRLMGKIMRVVNTIVAITLFLSTLNVNAVDTSVSFSEPPEPTLSSERAANQLGSEKTVPEFDIKFNPAIIESLL